MFATSRRDSFNCLVPWRFCSTDCPPATCNASFVYVTQGSFVGRRVPTEMTQPTRMHFCCSDAQLLIHLVMTHLDTLNFEFFHLFPHAHHLPTPGLTQKSLIDCPLSSPQVPCTKWWTPASSQSHLPDELCHLFLVFWAEVVQGTCWLHVIARPWDPVRSKWNVSGCG